MPKIDDYEKGQLKSVTSKAELTKLKAAARLTAIKETRFPHSMSDVHASTKEGMSERLPANSTGELAYSCVNTVRNNGFQNNSL